MDFNALGVQDWAKLQGLGVVIMLATIIRGACRLRLRGSDLKEIYRPKVLLRSSTVKLVKHYKKKYKKNKTKKARELFEALNVALGTEFDPKSAFSCT